MLDIETEEKLVEKVGGKFKLTKLIQQRLIELNRGAIPLVPVDDILQNRGSSPPRTRELLRIVVREILEDKIALAPKAEIQLSLEEEAARLREGKAEEIGFGEELKKIKEQRVKELTGFLHGKE